MIHAFFCNIMQSCGAARGWSNQAWPQKSVWKWICYQGAWFGDWVSSSTTMQHRDWKDMEDQESAVCAPYHRWEFFNFISGYALCNTLIQHRGSHQTCSQDWRLQQHNIAKTMICSDLWSITWHLPVCMLRTKYSSYHSTRKRNILSPFC